MRLRKMSIAVCAFFYWALAAAAADIVICGSDIQYDFDDEFHKQIILTTVDTNKSPQDLLDLLQSLNQNDKTSLLNRGMIARVIDNNQVAETRCTTLMNELILRQPIDAEKIAANLLKIQYLLDHGYLPNKFFTHSMPDDSIEISSLPLTNAIYMGNFEITKILIKHNANPKMIDPAGKPHTPNNMLVRCLFDSYILKHNIKSAGNVQTPPAPYENYTKIANFLWHQSGESTSVLPSDSPA